MIISLQVAHQVTNNMRYQRGKDKEQIQAMKQELESATEQLDEVIVDRENNANHSKRLNATMTLCYWNRPGNRKNQLALYTSNEIAATMFPDIGESSRGMPNGGSLREDGYSSILKMASLESRFALAID